jgi:hypothetical protein
MEGGHAMTNQQIRAFRKTLAFATLLLVGLASGGVAQLQNPSFESPDASGGDVPGTANWTSFNNVYTTATTAYTGTQCLKTFGPFVPAGGSGATQMLAAAPGQTWLGQILALNWSADPLDTVDFGVYKIEFLNSSLQLAAGGLAGVDIFESNPINASLSQDVWHLLGVGTAPAPDGTVWARAVIVKVDMDGAQGGSIFWDDASLIHLSPTGAPGSGAAAGLELRANTPNPFHNSTSIHFALAKEGPVEITIYDVAGRPVRGLLRANRPAGVHSVTWDGTTSTGHPASAGVYRCVLRSDGAQVARTMIRVR